MMSALIGAVVGGWITYKVATEDTRTQMVMNAYNLYLPEAFRAWSLAEEEKLTKDAKARLAGATAVLMIYGSEEVICRALAFERKIDATGSGSDPDGYFEIVLKMREEVTGEKEVMGLGMAEEECTYSIL